MHVPSSRVDALFTTRLSPTIQFYSSAISLAPRNIGLNSNSSGGGGNYSNSNGNGYNNNNNYNGLGLMAGPTNLQMTLMRDTGKWCTEYSYSADDSLWGFRFLHNFGVGGVNGAGAGKEGNGVCNGIGNPSIANPSVNPSEVANANNLNLNRNPNSTSPSSTNTTESKNTKTDVNPLSDSPLGLNSSRGNQYGSTSSSSYVEQQERQDGNHGDGDAESNTDTAVGGGLKGRFSAGAELFFSAAEKSAGREYSLYSRR